MKKEEAIFQELERERMEREAPGIEPSAQCTRFMIAGESPIIVEKACEFMIKELSVRAWRHTERNRRRTVQRQDVHAAVGESEMFDFLIDIVPRILPPAPPPQPPEASAGTNVPPDSKVGIASESKAGVATVKQEQQPQGAMNLSDAETRYSQLQEMQSQMHEHYNIMQQRAQADGSVLAQAPTQAAVEGQSEQPQVVLNPQLVIHPPQGSSMPQWHPEAPSGTDENAEGGS